MPEVLPQLALLVGLFFALIGYMAARGLLAAWTHSIGYLLEGLAGILKFSIGKGWAKASIDLGGPVRALDRAVISALQTWADGAEIEVGYFLHGNAVLWHWMASEIDSFAQASAQFGEWLVNIHLPKWAKVLAAAAVPFGLIAKLVHDALAKALPHLIRYVKEIEHALPGKTITIVKQAGAVAIPGAIGIPRIWHGIDDLRKWRVHVNLRLSRLEALFGATALSIAMANVLGIGSARCLRKGPIGKVSRALCGLSSHALNDILGLLADVLILEDICTVIPLLSEGFSVIEAPLNGFVGGIGSALCHGDYDAPPTLDLPSLSLPPVSGRALSLA